MQGTQNMEALQRWFEALNKGDVSTLDGLAVELFAPDFILHDPRMPDFIPGPAGVKRFIHQVLSENTGIHVTVEDIFTAQDRVACRFSVTMTDAATGEAVRVQLLSIDRFVEGQVVEEWQLGVRGQW